MPDLTKIWQAMRIARRVRDAQHGRWRIRHFDRSRDDVLRDETRIRVESPIERHELELRRVIPPGRYVSLQRRMTDIEKRDAVEEAVGGASLDKVAEETGRTVESILEAVCPPDRAWSPVMSDTPAELEGHKDAVENATGRVLVTGLGLGCVIAGLLVKPEVTRIDVVEIDPDVIALTSRYYLQDERVHLHVGSAADPATVPADLRWDYAWHDIWTHIAERNLNDATAEHGISYERLFDLYGDRADLQAAWAYGEAREMAKLNEEERLSNIAWYETLIAASESTQVQMLQDRVIGDTHPVLRGRITPEIRQMFDPDMKMAAHLRQRIRREPGFLEGLREISAKSVVSDDPIGNPNDHLEKT